MTAVCRNAAFVSLTELALVNLLNSMVFHVSACPNYSLLIWRQNRCLSNTWANFEDTRVCPSIKWCLVVSSLGRVPILTWMVFIRSVRRTCTGDVSCGITGKATLTRWSWPRWRSDRTSSTCEHYDILCSQARTRTRGHWLDVIETIKRYWSQHAKNSRDDNEYRLIYDLL